jgi:predicted ATPase/DNA-binding winged helix-turn-helix (wHTH) protein
MGMPVRALVYAYGSIEVDLGRREFRVHGAPVALGDRALAIVEALLEAPGELVTKDQLMRRIWGGVVVEENTLEVHVSAVRKALGPDRALLKTAYGRGYRLLGTWLMRDTADPADTRESVLRRQAVPPLASNLPLATSELIGRAASVTQVTTLLSAHRLVTLTGLGGIGKTRLAIEVARQLLEAFDGDARLAELAPLSDPSLVPLAVATAVGLRLGAAAPVAATVAKVIGDRRLLLVLDNCEHVIDAAAGLAEAIVRNCPHACILATSREALRAESEQVYRVLPLDVPAPHVRAPDAVLGHGAVALFVERMRASDAGIVPRDEGLATIAAICRRLDGVPLAIEFAAARAGTLGLQQVLSRLDDRFGLLTGGRRTALPRQQTLRATLDWSYELLPEIEQQLLRRIGVMAGGFSAEAAKAVAGGDTGHDAAGHPTVMESLSNLVEKALVTLEDTGAATRFRLLDTVRAYALEKLAACGERDVTARRHADFFHDLFVPTGGDRELAPTVERMAIYRREIDNVRAALDWTLSEAGNIATGAALTAAYLPYLLQHSSMVECRDRAERVLAHLPVMGLSAALEAQLHISLGLALVYTTSQVERTGEVLARAVDIATGLEEAGLLLQALWATFIYKLNNSEHRAARSFAERFSDLARREGDAEDVLMGDRVMGTTLHYAGDQPEARRRYDRYLQLYATPRLHRHLTWLHYDGPVLVKTRLARVLWLQGLADQAGALAAQNVLDARALDHPMSECLAIGEAACPIALMTGDFGAAENYLLRLADIATRQSFSFWIGIAKCLEAKLLIRRGAAAEGAVLLQAAIDSLATAQQSMHYAGFVPDLAEGVAATGDFAAAVAIVEEAMARAERTGVQWHVPELLRMKGELLLRFPSASPAPSEACFRSAIDLAGQQGALCWQLRAALSLARLLLRQGHLGEARRLLKPVYALFTEGFATADLRSSRALLEGGPASASGEWRL